jgi:hypothetical protein
MGFDMNKEASGRRRTIAIVGVGICRIPECGEPLEASFGETMIARIPMHGYVQPMRVHVLCAERRGALNLEASNG